MHLQTLDLFFLNMSFWPTSLTHNDIRKLKTRMGKITTLGSGKYTHMHVWDERIGCLLDMKNSRQDDFVYSGN